MIERQVVRRVRVVVLITRAPFAVDETSLRAVARGGADSGPLVDTLGALVPSLVVNVAAHRQRRASQIRPHHCRFAWLAIVLLGLEVCTCSLLRGAKTSSRLESVRQ
jgi:hypothetical protein